MSEGTMKQELYEERQAGINKLLREGDGISLTG
jgi:hypothetical protein